MQYLSQVNNRKWNAQFGVVESGYHESEESILKRADNELYRAKHNGKNQVSVG
jgi:PleD family two-component response regulator